MGSAVELTFLDPAPFSLHLFLAFAVSAQELEPWERWLEQHHVVIESRVRWERGGQSIYFRDPDGHLLELVTPGCWAIY